MSADEKFDGLFMTVAQQANGIEPLLDQLFGFLRRKTDFYSAPSEKIEDMVMGVLQKHGELVQQDKAKKAASAAKEKKRKDGLALKKKAAEDAKIAAAKKVSGEEDVVELGADGSFDSAAAGAQPPTPPVSKTAVPKKEKKEKKEGEEGEEDVVEEEEDNTPAPEGNGGSTDKFVWTQTLAEVTVSIPLPAGTKARMLNVDIKNTSLKVTIKGQDSPLVMGDLHKRVYLDDSLWQVADDCLEINLVKDNKMEWWKCVLQGDAEINTQKVQPENSKLGDLDGETRQTVEKMMFDQRQKAAGLPSSEELQKQEMMKKFMTAHPEMDFSQAKFT